MFVFVTTHLRNCLTTPATFLRVSILLLLIPLLLPLVSTDVMADSDNQIFVNRDQNCSEIDGVNYCTSIRTVIVQTSPNNGGLNVVANGFLCSTATNNLTGELISENCTRFNSHTHYRDNLVIKEEGGRYNSTSVYGEETCTMSGAFHYTNGQFQFNRDSFECN